MQEKERWSKDKFEIANKAKSEAARLSSLENEAAEKAKYVALHLLSNQASVCNVLCCDRVHIFFLFVHTVCYLVVACDTSSNA